MTAGSDDRLDSWKEIAAYLRRDVTTVQRWEKREGMPVHRHVHQKMGSVYAFKADLDAWARSRGSALVAETDEAVAVGGTEPPPAPAEHRRRWGLWLVAAAGAALIAFLGWQLQKARTAPENPLANARFLPLTDFDGIEQSAAISRDGRFVAFLSDRDGPMDVWVTQVGVGQFYNLTHGSVRELVNPSARTLGFSPDGTLVTFWTRKSDASGGSAVGVWAVPVLGGPPRPYLEGGAVEFDWSADGGAPGLSHRRSGRSPVRARLRPARRGAPDLLGPRGTARPLPHLVPGPGLRLLRPGLGTRPHGRLADQADRGKSRADHEPRLAGERSGLPGLENAAVPRQRCGRVRAVDLQPRRRAAPLSPRQLRHRQVHLARRERRRPARGGDARQPEGRAVARARLRCARAHVRRPPHSARHRQRLFTPASAPDYLLYVSSKASGDSIWKLQGETASEVWSAPDARILGGARGRARRSSHCLLDQAERTDVALGRERGRHGCSQSGGGARAAGRPDLDAGRSSRHRGCRHATASRVSSMCPSTAARRAPWPTSIPSIRRGRRTASSSCSRDRTSGPRSRSRPGRPTAVRTHCPG